MIEYSVRDTNDPDGLTLFDTYEEASLYIEKYPASQWSGLTDVESRLSIWVRTVTEWLPA